MLYLYHWFHFRLLQRPSVVFQVNDGPWIAWSCCRRLTIVARAGKVRCCCWADRCSGGLSNLCIQYIYPFSLIKMHNMQFYQNTLMQIYYTQLTRIAITLSL
jgi:hypothetical protein